MVITLKNPILAVDYKANKFNLKPHIMENAILTPQQLENVKDTIQTELLKRGFTAPILEFTQVSDKSGPTKSFQLRRLSFHTANFQTVPVLFRDLKIQSWNSSVFKSNSKVRVWVTVNCAYSIFSGGTNSSELFTIDGTFMDEVDTNFQFDIR